MEVYNILATKGTNVVTVRPDQTVREVVGLLAEHNVGALVVADSDLHCLGIISERDIVRRAAVDEGVFSLPVSDVMTSEVIVASLHHDLRPVAHTMLEKQIRHLPIVEAGRIMGILSIRDILKAQRDQLQGKVETITLQLLAEESTPQPGHGHAVQEQDETTQSKIVEHYATGELLARLEAALLADGVDPAHPTIEALAPYDHFHGRGLEATEDMAGLVVVKSTDHLLDIGSGLGGPARWLSTRFGCRVTGIDLTPEFCAIAEHFTSLIGLDARVRFQVGNALAMPFDDGTFEGAYSMFVSMNIADKARFYREIHRVLKAGGWLVLSEVARGKGGDVIYPMPWAATAAESFLSTADDTRKELQSAGFEVEQVKNALQRAIDSAAQSRAMVERGEKPPYRANAWIHGNMAGEMLANVARGYHDGSLVPIEVVARKR